VQNADADGLATDCNCIYLPYLDGGSFSGAVNHPVPVSTHPGKFLHYRGLANLDATLDHAFSALGLGDATEMVVTGGSAGGLSTFLHVDRVAARMKAGAPACKRTTGAPVVGFFLDHAAYLSTATNYSTSMGVVVHDQNATGALLPSCLAAFPTSPHLCFMSPHMVRFVQSPLFVFNSRFDAWQMDNDLQIPCHAGDPAHPKCSADEQAAIVQYGADFVTALAAVSAEPKNGAFITSCICHGCDWATLALDNATSYQHYARWYHGTADGGTVHVDKRMPNGGGEIKLTTCMPFP
jgi:hypothetical protein